MVILAIQKKAMQPRKTLLNAVFSTVLFQMIFLSKPTIKINWITNQQWANDS